MINKEFKLKELTVIKFFFKIIKRITSEYSAKNSKIEHIIINIKTFGLFFLALSVFLSLNIK